jgi:hypothetical protein
LRTETLYVCEICETRHSSRRIAEACEVSVLPPCPVSVGDPVRVRQRYDDPEPDVVVAVSIRPTMLAQVVANIEDGDGREAEFATGSRRLHRWAIQVSKRHQTGKDEFTDVVGVDDLVLDGRSRDAA